MRNRQLDYLFLLTRAFGFHLCSWRLVLVGDMALVEVVGPDADLDFILLALPDWVSCQAVLVAVKPTRGLLTIFRLVLDRARWQPR